MAVSSISTSAAELHRMFSNLDANVIASVLTANNGQIDVTIDHLLVMSVDTENSNNTRQVALSTPLRQLPVVPNIYDDDPPPYPGHETAMNHHVNTISSLPQRSSSNDQSTTNPDSTNNSNLSSRASACVSKDLEVRKWKTAYGQYRVCYIGDLPNDFLQVKFSTNSNASNHSQHKNSSYHEDQHLLMLFRNEEFLHELRQNKEFLRILNADQITRSQHSSSQQRRSLNNFSTKPLPLPTPPTVEVPKTPKIRAKMLQNVLSQIEQGQTIKTSMVPEDSITQNEGYSYGQERIPLPPAPFVNECDPSRSESNEEFISRLKNMGKNSMEKFNQLARRFSARKDTMTVTGKYSKQGMIPNTAERQRLTNELDSDDEPISFNANNTSQYFASI